MPSSTPDDRLRGLVDPVDLTVALARIDSVNPSLVPGAAGEAEVARFVAAWGRAHGLEVHEEDVGGDRPNVVLVRRGSGGGRSIVLNGHLDTVGAASPTTMEVHVDGDRATGRVIGRGVLDTKGGLACALAAVVGLAADDLAGDVLVAAVVDEEHSSLGTEAFVARWHADAAVVLEPTSFTICVGHRGFAVIDVVVTGTSSHTSRPDRGANAAHAAAAITAAVLDLDTRWASSGTPIGERPLTLVNRIVTESETFTVPSRATMTIEVRTTGDDPQAQIDEVLAAIDRAAHAASGIAQTSQVVMSRPPLATPGDHPLVDVLRATAPNAAAVGDAPFWTDAALHAGSGTPAVVLGPTGAGLHEDLEWVSIESLDALTRWLSAAVAAWCGPVQA